MLIIIKSDFLQSTLRSAEAPGEFVSVMHANVNGKHEFPWRCDRSNLIHSIFLNSRSIPPQEVGFAIEADNDGTMAASRASCRLGDRSFRRRTASVLGGALGGALAHRGSRGLLPRFLLFLLACFSGGVSASMGGGRST